MQKYLHDLAAWNAVPTEEQERIVGRTKVADIELDDGVKPTSAHNAVNTIVENGVEVKILRNNMPFGHASTGEFGTYFIGYSRTPRPPSRCWRTCSSAGLPGTTTAFWISAGRSLAASSSVPR